MKRALLAALVFVVAACGGSGGDGSTDPANKSSLTVSISGSGHVTSLPTGIDCSAVDGTSTGTCTAQFAAGSDVYLLAVAADGQVLQQWSGACSGASGCDIPLSGSQTVAAAFTVVQRTLKLSYGSPRNDDGIAMMTFSGPSFVSIRPRAGIEIVAREVSLPGGQLQTTLLVSGTLSSGILGEFDVRGGPPTGAINGQVTQAAANASGNYVRRTSLTGYSAAATP